MFLPMMRFVRIWLVFVALSLVDAQVLGQPPTASPIEDSTTWEPTLSPTTSITEASQSPTTPPVLSVAEALLSVGAGQEASLRNKLLASNATRMTSISEGMASLVQRISANPSDNVSIMFEVACCDLRLEFPASLLSSLSADEVLQISTFEMEHENVSKLFTTNNVAATALGIVTISIADIQTGSHREVRYIDHPITFTLPVNKSSGASCYYWDETRKAWSKEGISDVPSEGSDLLHCSTRHLSVFGGILTEIATGSLKTHACLQFGLMSQESYSNVLNDWSSDVTAPFVWILIFVSTGIILTACVLDWRRTGCSSKTLDDEFFLYECGILGEVHEDASNESTRFHFRTCLPAAGVACKNLFSTVGQCIDIVLTYVLDFFRDFRGGLVHASEQIWKVVSSRDIGALVIAFASWTAQNASIRLASESQGLLVEVDLLEEVLELGEDTSARTERNVKNFSYARELLNRLHEAELADADKLGLWKAIPHCALRLLKSRSAIVQILSHSVSSPASARALLVVCKLFGTVLIVTFFCASSGPLRRTDYLREEEGEPECGLWRKVGSLILVGVGSAVASSIPVALLKRCHSRKVMRLDYAGSCAWKRQLLRWRLQHICMWIIGVAFLSFSTHIVILFFGSSVPEDHISWLVGSGVGILMDYLTYPLGMGILESIVVSLVISAVSRMSSVKDHPLVLRRTFLSTQNKTSEGQSSKNCDFEKVDENRSDEASKFKMMDTHSLSTDVALYTSSQDSTHENESNFSVLSGQIPL